jgi:3alpha(or 20beta)-hydroxysteroid dehydrogenase
MRDGLGTGRGGAAQRFQGRTVIVTGGAAGQGRREVACFADEGARVVLVDLDGEASAAEQEHSGRVRSVVADVSDREAWHRVLARAEGWAPPTVLVNNAAIHWARPIESSEPADVLRMWQINLLGPLLGIQAVVPVMRAAGGGSIVNISSTAGLTGLPYQASYGASKWGLRGLTKAAAVELAGIGVRVNSIHPGPIETEMMRSSPTYSTGGTSRFAHIPLGRAGTLDEVAAAVLFLASDESSYITGAELAVDGGMVAGRPPSYEWTPELDARPRRVR